MNAFISLAITLFLVIDALGTLPIYLSMTKKYSERVRLNITIRELFFALVLMILFNYVGEYLLTLLGITPTTIKIASGAVLLLISINLLFQNRDDEGKGLWGEGKPFIVPIATPLFAGPSVLAVIMIFAQEESSYLVTIGAIVVSWFFSAILFIFAPQIFSVLKERGLMAAQRLMGLLIAIIAVQALIGGLADLMKEAYV